MTFMNRIRMWFGREPKPEPEPEQYEVGKAIVHVELKDDRTFDLVYMGWALDVCGQIWTYNAMYVVDEWKKLTGKRASFVSSIMSTFPSVTSGASL